MSSASNGTSPLPEPVLETVLALWAQAGREHDVPVRGYSMWPLVRQGDVARIVHGVGGLKRGNIIAYQRNREVIIHRLLRCNHRGGESLYLTQGDNASTRDPAVRASQVLGRAVALQRDGSWRRLDTPLMRGIGWAIATFSLGRLALSRILR